MSSSLGHGPSSAGQITEAFPYADVTRYTTSGSLRMKLGDALEKRGVAPHIYESAEEAEKLLQEIDGSRP